MDKIIILIIILIAITNAIVRAFKEKQAKERGPKAPPKERAPSPLEQFLKGLHIEGVEEPVSTLEEELPAEPLPEKKPIRIEEQVEKVKPTLAERFASHKPEELTAKEPVFKPLIRPLSPRPPEFKKAVTPAEEQVEKVKPTLAERFASHKPEELTAKEPVFKPLIQPLSPSFKPLIQPLSPSFKPLIQPLSPRPPEFEKTITPAIEVTADTARGGIIMAEILGPALAKRRMGIRSRRLF